MKKVTITDSGEPISDIEYGQFVSEFNLSLPDSYKEFILENNGGYPEESSFDSSEEDGYDINIDNFNRISVGDEVFEELEDKVYSAREAIQDHQISQEDIPSHLYPFALVLGGNNLCISMKNEDFGSIYIYALDGRTPVQRYVASSFEELINGLFFLI